MTDGVKMALVVLLIAVMAGIGMYFANRAKKTAEDKVNEMEDISGELMDNLDWSTSGNN